VSLPTATAYGRAATRYADDAVGTASPARLLVLLYDRLVLDLTRGHQAQLDGDRQVAHDNLAHAQDIVAELLSSLDLEVWEGGRELARLYQWLIAELVRANVSGDARRTADCLAVVQPLRDAWADAATTATAPERAVLAAGLTG
jgi:flagellar protein FliS